MTDWNNEDGKCFRDYYVKRLSHSLDERQLSRDGRLRCSEEMFDVRRKDLNSQNRNVGKATGKDCKKDSSEESQVKDWDIPKRRKEEEEDIDEEALKEKKRTEQIEKARQAMERRKKLQEKAATKAAIRAQKEAEKKLKEQEQKAKKKKTNATAIKCSSDKDETAAEVCETDLTKAKSCRKEKPLVIPKHISLRQRRGRGGGLNAVPKSTIKRQKGFDHWVLPFTIVLTIFVMIMFKGVSFCYLHQLDCFSF